MDSDTCSDWSEADINMIVDQEAANDTITHENNDDENQPMIIDDSNQTNNEEEKQSNTDEENQGNIDGKNQNIHGENGANNVVENQAQETQDNERLKNVKNGNCSDDSDDVPLIKVTKNQAVLMQQNALNNASRKLKEGAVKRLNKRTNRTIAKDIIQLSRNKSYLLRKRKKQNTEDELNSDFEEDSGDDATYKPSVKDIHSSDSEVLLDQHQSSDAESIENIHLARRKKKPKAKSMKILKLQEKLSKNTRRDENSGRKRGLVTVKTKRSGSMSQKIAQAIERSRKTEANRRQLLQYHTARLDNLLFSNGLKRVAISADGNCFLSAILHSIQSEDRELNVGMMRTELVDHLKQERSHYTEFLAFSEILTEEEKNKKYDDYLLDFSQDGHWNTDLADLMPLAIANIHNRPIRVYSSKVSNSVYDICPDMEQHDPSTNFIKVALFSITGQEHYDAVNYLDTIPSAPTTSKSPVRNHASTPISGKQRRSIHVTPRKRASYKSPVKKELFRKKRKNQESWKRHIRKHNRVHGLPYIGRTGKEQDKKTMKYKNCSKCRFGCSNKISEENAQQIFSTYYQLGSYEKQRNFICQHVEQTKAKRCSTNRKEKSNAYFLTVNQKKERICKTFFLCILNISQKTVAYALRKKQHGIFVGGDNRGKKSSVNRTPDVDRNFIKEHIQSFPTVSSHYTRKDSNRKYLSANLSLPKMYQLYEDLCKKRGRKPCKINVYREIFCNEFNLSFHKPKKDQCSICTIYNDKKQRGETDENDEDRFECHQRNKQRSRDEKSKDKERAKTDKSFVAATFDLEAVLPTPCSMVGDIFYKRCLSTYNLSFYSLGDGKGTCYLWDETNGGRGSSEIGSCILMHINSVTEKKPHVQEITYYSDTCGGQNRNQFVASAMLYAMHHHENVKKINHKFFERGHSEMEADSIHSSVERAKKSTKVYHPSQWDTVVSMARKKNPYIVIPLSFRDFYDLKKLRHASCKNMKETATGAKINWLKVKWIKVTKDTPDSIFFNYSFDEENFMEVKVRAVGLRGRKAKMSNIKLSPLHETKLSISEAKKADLLSLCKTGVIPPIYHNFYEHLPSGKSVKDILPQPDVTEEDVLCD